MKEKRVRIELLFSPTPEQQSMVMSSSTETKYPEYQKFLELHGDEIKLCVGRRIYKEELSNPKSEIFEMYYDDKMSHAKGRWVLTCKLVGLHPNIRKVKLINVPSPYISNEEITHMLQNRKLEEFRYIRSGLFSIAAFIHKLCEEPHPTLKKIDFSNNKIFTNFYSSVQDLWDGDILFTPDVQNNVDALERLKSLKMNGEKGNNFELILNNNGQRFYYTKNNGVGKKAKEKFASLIIR